MLEPSKNVLHMKSTIPPKNARNRALLGDCSIPESDTTHPANLNHGSSCDKESSEWCRMLSISSIVAIATICCYLQVLLNILTTSSTLLFAPIGFSKECKSFLRHMLSYISGAWVETLRRWLAYMRGRRSCNEPLTLNRTQHALGPM